LAAASYLVQTRNGVYCARFVVPLTHRGSSTSAGREIRVSTLTKDPRDAVARARLLRVLYESLLQQGGVFCRESISTYFQSIMAQFKAPPPGTPKFGMEYDFATGKVKFEDVRPGEEATVMSMMEDMQKRIPVPIAQVAIAPPPPPAAAPVVPARTDGLSEDARLPIATMVDEYLASQEGRAQRKEIGPKNVSQRATRLRLFACYFEGKAIGDITPNDIKTYMDDIAYYPTSRDVIGIAPGRSVRDVIKLSKANKLRRDDGKPYDTLSEATVKGYMLALANFIGFCDLKLAVLDRTASRMKSIVDAAPRGERNAKEPFTDDELTGIFSCRYFWQPAYNLPHQYWTPVIGLFTGARLSEICQLTTGDIKEYAPGAWQISFNDDEDGEDDDDGSRRKSNKRLKNKSSRRVIPVHPQLVELGLIDYWKKRKKEGDVNLLGVEAAEKDGYGKVPGDFFRNRLLREYVGINSETKVFHSFRYTFITRLRQAIIDNAGTRVEENIENYPEGLVLRQMVGHSIASGFTRSTGKSDVHISTYMGEVSMEARVRLLNRLDMTRFPIAKYKDVKPGQRIRYNPEPKSFQKNGVRDFGIDGGMLGGLV